MAPAYNRDLAPEDFRDALEAAFREGGVPLPILLGMDPIPGGSINQTFHLKTADGDFFCKWNPQCPSGMFHREREGLRALAGSGTSLRIPRVVGATPEKPGAPALLVMRYLEPETKGASRRTWENLGRGLAELHRHGSDRFGFGHDNYCGLTLQDNTWTAGWAEFYGRRRLEALIRTLRNRGDLAAPAAAEFSGLLEKLAGLLAHSPTPSLIHGDLWSGNFLATTSGPALVDPAAYYADREAEWGMMSLFGGFPDAVLDAYQEAWPLPAGWRDRMPLYQLYHVLNHFLLFGGSYGEQALRIARKFN